jgi:hypothetical protein
VTSFAGVADFSAATGAVFFFSAFLAGFLVDKRER